VSRRAGLAVLVWLLVAGCRAVPAPGPRLPAAGAGLEVGRVDLPAREPVRLVRSARIDCPEIDESSGLVRSRTWKGIYWTHNDSGDRARIFAIDRQGAPLAPEWLQGCPGITVHHAANIDWEDIAADNEGNLLIAACGNNDNARRDLGIYVVPEPNPYSAVATRSSAYYRFRFPEQHEFPPRDPAARNFDCEALFWARGRLYLLTKHRGNTLTRLYRFERLERHAVNLPALIGVFDIGGMVTAADATPDGRSLAVLTYGAIWVFTAPEESDRYFDGAIRWLPIYAGQCEAICFDGEELVLTDEAGELFVVPLSELITVRQG
jgi:hypothetical protein